MCRDDDGTPMTARRFRSLAGAGGDDDMFSDGFTEQQLQVCFLVLSTLDCCLHVCMYATAQSSVQQ